MADKNVIDCEEMIKTARELQQLSEKYKEEYEGMYLDMETSRPVSIGNADMKEFYSQIKKFEIRFKQMKQLIDQFAETIKGAAKTYEDIQGNNINMAKKLGEF